MATRKFRKSIPRARPRKTVRRPRASTAGKILPPLDVRSNKHLAEFEKRIKNGPLTIVLVYADWCGHCHTMMPHYDAAAKSPGRSIQAIKVNEQMLPAINKSINDKVNKSASPLNVEGYPSIIIVDKKGNVVSNIEPVRNTSTMTSLMSKAGPLAESAAINKINEPSPSLGNNAAKNINGNSRLANFGIDEEGLVSGPTTFNSLRNSDVGEDKLLGSIASKNNKNKNINLASIATNNLGATRLNSGKDTKESLKNASAPSPLNTFGEENETPRANILPSNLKKEADAIGSLISPLMPPSIGNDMEEKVDEDEEGEDENEFSISNKLTPAQKVSGGSYGSNKNGGSLYAAIARTTYTLAPAAALLATAALVMKGNKRSTNKRSTNKKKHNRRSANKRRN